MNEKEAIEMLDKFITEHKLYNIKQSDNLEDNIDIVLNLISKLQKENEKQGKVIDEMINHIEHTCYYQDDYGNSCDVIQDTCVNRDKDCKKCIKQYFYGKVEEE